MIHDSYTGEKACLPFIIIYRWITLITLNTITTICDYAPVGFESGKSGIWSISRGIELSATHAGRRASEQVYFMI
jgi:hypothetical protein